MKIVLTKIVPLGILSLALCLFSGPASADYSAVNSQTGFESVNAVSANSVVIVEEDNCNDVDEDNIFWGDGITGFNSSDYNFYGAGIETGDADILGGFLNQGNLNSFEMLGDDIGDFFALNQLTGAFSDNNADVFFRLAFDLDNSNLNDLLNSVTSRGITGYNTVQYNQGTAEILTGDADTILAGGNLANGNFTELAIAPGNGEVAVGNFATGAESDNDVDVDVLNEADVFNLNLADIENCISTESNTGQNFASFNGDCFGCGPDGSLVETGDAETEISLINEANENQTIILAGLGNSEIEAFNENTGFSSSNDLDLDIYQEIDVDNRNDADFDNRITSVTNTGFNIARYNSGLAGIGTGNAGVDIEIENMANANQTAIASALDTSIEAGNSSTGACSDNEVEIDIKDKIFVDNRNDADIDNRVTVNSNTGYNRVEMNSSDPCSGSGCGSASFIETGDTVGQVSISNNVNTNQTEISSGGPVDIIAGNECTGANSDNSVSVDSYSKTVVNNKNNADINNNVNVQTNTGNNTSAYNLGSSAISTGDSSVVFGISNQANANSTEIGN